MDTRLVVLNGIKDLRDKASQRVADAEKAVVQAQQAHMAAINEFRLWTAAIERLTQEEEQTPSLPPQITPGVIAEIRAGAGEPVNRVMLVMDTLRLHPDGLTQDQLYALVQPSVDKAYFYSITKRLRDRREIELRDGKFRVLQPDAAAASNEKEVSPEEKTS